MARQFVLTTEADQMIERGATLIRTKGFPIEDAVEGLTEKFGRGPWKRLLKERQEQQVRTTLPVGKFAFAAH